MPNEEVKAGHGYDRRMVADEMANVAIEIAMGRAFSKEAFVAWGKALCIAVDDEPDALAAGALNEQPLAELTALVQSLSADAAELIRDLDAGDEETGIAPCELVSAVADNDEERACRVAMKLIERGLSLRAAQKMVEAYSKKYPATTHDHRKITERHKFANLCWAFIGLVNSTEEHCMSLRSTWDEVIYYSETLPTGHVALPRLDAAMREPRDSPWLHLRDEFFGRNG